MSTKPAPQGKSDCFIECSVYEHGYMSENTNIHNLHHRYEMPDSHLDEYGYVLTPWDYSFCVIDDFGNSVGVSPWFHGSDELPYFIHGSIPMIFPVIH